MEKISIDQHFNISDIKNIENFDNLKSLIDKVNEIYFTNYSAQRCELLKCFVFDVIKVIDECLQNSNILNKTELAFLYFTKSHCLDKLPEYNKQAEESASKSLKLNPFNADNYNCIAHILWKKGDIEAAINYYNKALEINPKNKSALKSLSMIVRTVKENSNMNERVENCKKSIDYAKKAIGIDMKDSDSWYVNANAYFHNAFVSNNQYEDLKFALNSYNFSEKYQKEFKNPDLYYNRAIVHSYLENYNDAYNDFVIAHKIDETLKADQLSYNIVESITQVCKLVKNKCSIKPKKLSQLLHNIPVNLKEDLSYNLGMVDNLISGENKSILISAKSIQITQGHFEVPFTIVCVDHNGTFFSLSFYNVGKNFIETIQNSKSHIVILDPILKIISLSYNNKKYEYPCIQIINLSKVLIDGKYCSNFTSQSLLNSKFFN